MIHKPIRSGSVRARQTFSTGCGYSASCSRLRVTTPSTSRGTLEDSWRPKDSGNLKLAPRASCPVIEAEHLSKSYGKFVALRDTTLRVEAGEVFGFLGPNGAGKSTTTKIFCGLV